MSDLDHSSLAGSRGEIIRSMEPFVREHLEALLKPAEESWQPADFLPDLANEDWRGQLAEFRERAQALPARRGLTAAEAMAILVEKIKHPAASVEALSRRLAAQSLRVEPERIGAFLAQHGVGVKKTPPSV